MTAASGPTGILAGRPSDCQSQLQNGTATKASKDNKKVAVLKKGWSKEKEDLVTRTSVIDAKVAMDQINKGKAQGEKWKMKCRDSFQRKLYKLGRCEYKHVNIFLIVVFVALSSFGLALKSRKFHHKVEELWIPMGGRLEEEILNTTKHLGEATMSTHQLLIQTPTVPGENILQSTALLEHLEVLKLAMKVTVEVDAKTWTLSDLCYKAPPPIVEDFLSEKIFDSIIPCTIITPLDCFWEGSKLLGPNEKISIGIKHLPIPPWSHLNPGVFLSKVKKEFPNFNFNDVEKFMKRAGVTSGYQEKPCLNPKDPDCPVTAPNYQSKMQPDIGADLTGGCYGFAENLLHWPEELIVGGASRNKTGHITRADAVQSVVQLMSEKELEEFWKDRPEVKRMAENWNKTTAGVILKAWQSAFSKKVQEPFKLDMKQEYNFLAFSTITLNDILEKYTEVSFIGVAISRAMILLYVGLVLYNRKDAVRSQTTVGVAGVLLAFVAEFSAVGMCAITQTPFNVVITQTVPFVNIVLTVSDIFLVTHSYSDLSMTGMPGREQLGMILKRIGPQVFLTRLCSSAAFFSSWLIPIPALREFAQHAGMLNLLGLAVTLLIFPLLISLDLKRRHSRRHDIFCCCAAEVESARTFHNSQACSGKAKQAVTRAMPPDRVETCTQILTTQDDQNEFWVGGNVIGDADESTEADTLTGCSQDDCLSFSLSYWVKNYYAPFITKRWIKMVAMSFLGMIVVVCVWQAMQVKNGLELTDIVPQNSDEHAFLTAQSNHFGFYNMFAVTGEFNYAAKQDELHDYYKKLSQVKNVISSSSGGSQSNFWLILFTNWLKDLQTTFDKEKAQGKLDTECWYGNASDDAILAYKLIVQTGDPQDPIDKRRVDYAKLVVGDRINKQGFYFYLSAWVGNDALAYEVSQANIRPKPNPWSFSTDTELKIPKSGNIKYAQIPFDLHKLTNTEKITEMIFRVRQICQHYTQLGIPNFPWGIPFQFWDQYMDLRTYLAYALGAAGLSIAIIISILLMNFRAVLLVLFYLAGIVLQLLGIMGFCNINLSAVPAVLLVVSVGISVPFSVHFCLSFVTSIGSRDRRTRLALEHTFAPVMHGGVITLLSVMMLAFSEFDFVVRYFFLLLFSAVVVGLINGLFFFPILLSLIGPAAEIISNEHPDRISTPTPPASPVVRRLKAPALSRRPHKSESARVHNEPSPSPSLSTITEEPSSWHSTQESCNIIVQPEVKVETTSTTCSNQNCSGSDQNGSSHTSSASPMSHITTKITATANIKVELHTSGMDRRNKCRHGGSGRRSARFSTNVNSTESSSSSSEQDSDPSSSKH
ncbi:protein patched isoform X2 [Belonocnema kinseyi]|uniref:protein patched isoform X2 n=1 Tax=Belonocnema kinseyi TaxID=2817044 RepID=UPI00143CC8E4|nr:protein patched isoform X2 [Belonocnema kinseyi]